jgi:hypothetical protein
MKINCATFLFALLLANSFEPILVQAQSGFSITPKVCEPLFFHSQSHTFSSSGVHAPGSWNAHLEGAKLEEGEEINKQLVQQELDQIGKNSVFFEKISDMCRQELNRQATASTSDIKNNTKNGASLSGKDMEPAENDY